MFVTFDMLKWETSRAVRALQLENIMFMFVTCDVSKWETSMEVIEVQKENMYDEFCGSLIVPLVLTDVIDALRLNQGADP